MSRSKSHPFFELLENRTLLSAAGVSVDLHRFNHDAAEIVYTESNNPQPGQNAVLALRQGRDGSLQPIGKFLTGGTGQANPTQGLGPDDSDQEVVASRDGRFLFAVNQGSNSVAVFRIHHDGRLTRVGTYDSGGTQPVSLGLAGDRLYVTNRGDALQNATATIAPNYTGFRVNRNGSLSAIPNSTVTLPVGLSPSQTLISPDGRFVFGDNFAIPGTTPTLGNTIDPFRIAADGTLQPVPGAPIGAGTTLLGLAVDPTQRIIYGGLTGAAQVGVFTYDDSGSITFVRAVADQGKGPCWALVSSDGRFLYVANTGTNSVGVYSLHDPLNPQEIQDFKLNIPQPPAGSTSAPVGTFEIAIDPSRRNLDVITQTTAANHDFPQGNAVHSLAIDDDGTLSEPTAPVTFSTGDVPGEARIQGIAIVSVNGDDRDLASDSRGRRN